MAFFELNIPNDYNSESDVEKAIDQCYEGNNDSASNDVCRECFEILAMHAQESGLKYVEESTYGAIWEGTEEQFLACVAALPEWAKRYASTFS